MISFPLDALLTTATYLHHSDLHNFSQTTKSINLTLQSTMCDRQCDELNKTMALSEWWSKLSNATSAEDYDEERILYPLYGTCNIEGPIRLKRLQYLYICRCFYCLSVNEWWTPVEKELAEKDNIDDRISILKSKINNVININGIQRIPVLNLAIAAFKETAIIEILLNWGANPNGIPDGEKEGNALGMALRYDRVKHLAVLKRYGAEPDGLYMGSTALHKGINPLDFEKKASLETIRIFINLFHPNPCLDHAYRKRSPKAYPGAHDYYQIYKPDFYNLLVNYEREYTSIDNPIKQLLNRLSISPFAAVLERVLQILKQVLKCLQNSLCHSSRESL